MVLKLYLENFKSLNKTFGYDYCEELLSQIKSYLKEVAEGNIYRYIGVEFIIILEQLSEGKACDLADEILERFGNVWKIRGVDCLCSAQIGLCSYPGHATSTCLLYTSQQHTVIFTAYGLQLNILSLSLIHI